MSAFAFLRNISIAPGDFEVRGRGENSGYGDIRETLIFDCADTRSAFLSAVRKIGIYHQDSDEVLGEAACDCDPGDLLIVTPAAVIALIAALRTEARN
ncbi:hypothetical protein [Falsirhodobacter xinxiangensis]|uniref:hypothetical protein n=1 Tax=Falsirhodobacter xinxiangensis TaxID=2530049 RepID=UPI0010AA67A0|nr:hypothetical protein [Rhodobacter xinxiangensis]